MDGADYWSRLQWDLPAVISFLPKVFDLDLDSVVLILSFIFFRLIEKLWHIFILSLYWCQTIFSPFSPTILYPDKFKEPPKKDAAPPAKRRRTVEASDEEEESSEEEEESEDEAPVRKRCVYPLHLDSSIHGCSKMWLQLYMPVSSNPQWSTITSVI